MTYVSKFEFSLELFMHKLNSDVFNNLSSCNLPYCALGVFISGTQFFFGFWVSNTYLITNNPAVSNMFSVFILSLLQKNCFSFNFLKTVKITDFCHISAILLILLSKKLLPLAF